MQLTRICTIVCATLSFLPLHAQYKAILSPPTAPGLATTQDDGVSALKGMAGGWAVGQYNKQAAKMLLADGSISPMDPGLSPTGRPYIYTEAMATDGNQSVGWGLDWNGSNYFETCIHWDNNGVPTKLVSPQWTTTHCNATSGGQHVGYVESYGSSFQAPANIRRAALWTSPTSFIDLHTGGNNFSEVLGIYGGQQVGYQSLSLADVIHGLYSLNATAYLWHGSSSGAVNLNPSGFTNSVAFATNGTQQAGWAYNANLLSKKHAMLWTGTAASAVDLNPPGFYDTQVTGMFGAIQVGDGYDQPVNSPGGHGNRHALVWFGSADSMVDLNPFLPLGFTNAVATGVDGAGNVIGYAWGQVGRAYQYMNVVFTPQPASASQLLSVTVTPGPIYQGDTIQGQVTLAGPAPAGGQALTLTACSQDGFSELDLAPTPPSLVVPEGQTTASFTVVTNGRFLMSGGWGTRVYANDGVVSRFGTTLIYDLPFLTAFSIPSVAGGSSTTGSLTVSSLPMPTGDAVITLTSSNPSLVSVPATVTIPQGFPHRF
jgi:hypothetical protein